MPRLIFLPRVLREDGSSMVVDRPQGGRLVDACDEAQAAIPFCCRGASCGICRVAVLDGGEYFEKCEAPELDLLEFFGSGPEVRLACQARLRPGPGLVRLRVLGT